MANKSEVKYLLMVYLFDKKFIYKSNSPSLWNLINKIDADTILRSTGEVGNSI